MAISEFDLHSKNLLELSDAIHQVPPELRAAMHLTTSYTLQLRIHLASHMARIEMQYRSARFRETCSSSFTQQSLRVSESMQKSVKICLMDTIDAIVCETCGTETGTQLAVVVLAHLLIYLDITDAANYTKRQTMLMYVGGTYVDMEDVKLHTEALWAAAGVHCL